MSWDYLLVQATNGAVIGVIYALIAVGVTLIFSILKIVNFAHGDLYMLGGYCAYFVIEGLGFPPLAAMVVAMGALFVGAIVLERFMLTPLYSDATERKDEYGLIVTFGLAYFLRNSAVIAFGPFPLKPPSFIPGVQRLGNLVVTNDRLVAAGVGIVLIAALLYFMKRTIWGQALDAVSQSRDSAAIVGINARRFNSFAFGIGAALAAAARHGRAAQHPRLRHRDPGRHGLGERQHHRGHPARGVREPLHRVLSGSDAGVRLHERVRRSGADGRPHLPAAGAVRPPPPADGVARRAGAAAGLYPARPRRAGARRCRPPERLLAARRHHRDVLRHPRRELVAARRLRGPVLAEPHRLRVDRGLHLGPAGEVAGHPGAPGHGRRRPHVLRARRGHRLGVPADERALSRDLHARVLGDRAHRDLDRGRRDRGHGRLAHRPPVPERHAPAL